MSPFDILTQAAGMSAFRISSSEALKELTNAAVRQTAKTTKGVGATTLEAAVNKGVFSLLDKPIDTLIDKVGKFDPKDLAGSAGSYAGRLAGSYVCPEKDTSCKETAAFVGWLVGQSVQGFGVSTVAGKAGETAGKVVGAYVCPEDANWCKTVAEYAGFYAAFGVAKAVCPIS